MVCHKGLGFFNFRSWIVTDIYNVVYSPVSLLVRGREGDREIYGGGRGGEKRGRMRRDRKSGRTRRRGKRNGEERGGGREGKVGGGRVGG